MNWEAIGAVGEVLGSIAVFVTLGYLALRMRQASPNQRSLMQQGRTARYVEILLARTQPSLSECYSLAIHNGTLDDSQWMAFLAHVDAYLWHFEDCHLQFEAGTIDQASWESDVATITNLVALPALPRAVENPSCAHWRPLS